jgi:hypothetical protein
MFTFVLITTLAHKPDVKTLLRNPGVIRQRSDGSYYATTSEEDDDGWVAVCEL